MLSFEGIEIPNHGIEVAEDDLLFHSVGALFRFVIWTFFVSNLTVELGRANLTQISKISTR